VFFPSGVGVKLQRGAAVIVEIEYVRPVSRASDRSAVGIFFGEGPFREIERTRLPRGVTELREEVTTVALRPELLSSGESLRVVAYLPDGNVEPLLWIRKNDAAYQTTYRQRRPMTLPKGTRVSVYAFDAAAFLDVDFVRSQSQSGSATGSTKETTATRPRR
jgi:hypothetical protein